MRTCRKSIATALPLLIYLLTSQTDGSAAGRDDANVSQVEGVPVKIILEKVILSGNESNTRIIAKAVAKDPSEIGDEMFSLLSSNQTRSRRHVNLDQNLNEAVIVNIEDDEDDLEMLKRVIAKYEPQRIVSRKAKRKIADILNAYDVDGEAADSTTGLERTSRKVLRNISGGKVSSQLAVDNIDGRSHLYPSRQTAYSRRTSVPHANSRTENPRSDVSSAYSKKKRLLKNYASANRSAASSRLPPVGQSEIDEEVITDIDESTTSKEYLRAPNEWITKPKNESSSDVDSAQEEESAENLREWNTEESLSQLVFPSASRSNDSNIANYHIDNLNDSDEKRRNLSSGSSTYRSTFERRKVPKPFSISRLADAATNIDVETPYEKLKLASANIKQQQRDVLPVDPFNPSTVRRYVPIKREKATAILGHGSSSANSANGYAVDEGPKSTYASPSHANVKTTPVVNTYNYHLTHYPVATENPAERTLARTDFASQTYKPVQTSASYVQRQKPSAPAALRNKGSLPALIPAYSNPKPDLSTNPAIALYNKFAGIYAIPNPPQIVKAPVLPHTLLKPVPLKSVPSALPKSALPIVTTASPHRQSKLLVSKNSELEKQSEDDKDSEESVETNIERSRIEDADEPETEIEYDRSNSGNYKGRTDREEYGEGSKATSTDRKIHETPNKRIEEEDHDEDRYQKERLDYEDEDKHYESDDEKDDEEDEKSEKFRKGDKSEDEKDVDETHECEYVKSNKDDKPKDKDSRDNHRRYNERKYDRDGPEEQIEKQHYTYGKYDKEEEDPRGEYDTGDFDYKFASEYYDHGPPSDHYEQKGSERGDRYAKNRQERKREKCEDDDPAEDESVSQRSGDQRTHGQDEKYGSDRNDDNDDDADEREYDDHRVNSHKDFYHREHKSPSHAEEYHYPHVRVNSGDRRKHSDESEDGKDDDAEHDETREYALKHEGKIPDSTGQETHQKDKAKHKDEKFEEGGSAEHEEEHHENEGEKEHKGYKAWEEHEDAEKGHRDKEHSSKEYEEKDGDEKKHEEEGGYHEKHQHGEKGEKSSEFGEKGEHKKGHNTKGEHLVHKKDEFEKKTEFFDEFHEGGDMKKDGEHYHEHESKKGGHEKKAHHDTADHDEKHGKGEEYKKGGHHHEHKGHEGKEGHEHHHSHNEKYGKKEGKAEEKSFKDSGKK